MALLWCRRQEVAVLSSEVVPPSKARTRWLVALLLCVYATLAMSSATNKSATFDETWHIGAGWIYWTQNDYRLSYGTGSIPKRLTGLPFIFQVAPLNLHVADWRVSQGKGLCKGLLFGEGREPLKLLWRARLMTCLVGVLLGLTIFLVARRLFGVAGGFVSLTAFAFSPAMLGNGRLATADLPASFAFLVATICVWRVLHLATPKNLLWSTLACGGLLLTKASGPLIGPLAFLFLGVRTLVGRPLVVSGFGRQFKTRRRSQILAIGLVLAAIHAGAGLTILWGGYGFRYSMYADDSPENRPLTPWPETIERLGLLKSAIKVSRDNQWVPESYLFGIARLQGNTNRLAYFRGDHSVNGRRSYFPYLLLTKTPLGILALLGLAAFALSTRGPPDASTRRPRSLLYRTLPLWLFFLVYGGISVASALNLGHRHLLPLYPALLIALGGVGALWRSKARVWRGAILASVALLILEGAFVFPHYHSFFNLLNGGPAKAWKQVADSSIDWGQDLPELKEWIEDKQKAEPASAFYLSYFGFINPESYGLTCAQMPAFWSWDRGYRAPADFKPGYYCISVSQLQGLYSMAPGAWCRPYEQRYQQLTPLYQAFRLAESENTLRELTQARGAAWWSAQLQEFRHLRLSRLCSLLRQRDPDARAGYSILIYKVDAAELSEATEGDRADLPHDPQIEGLDTSLEGLRSQSGFGG